MAESSPLREAWRSETRGVGRIESELVKLEHALALEQAEGETRLPVRTSLLNMVVYVTDEAELERSSDTVAHLAGRHPSRTIFVLPAASKSGEVEAELRAYCLAPSEDTPRICVEQICLRTGPLRPGNLPELLSPLLIADLPTYAWYPGLGVGDSTVLAALAELADRVLVDSGAAPDPSAALRALDPLGRQITDFTWMRLLPWCELTAQFFDAESSRRYLELITTLRIEYSGSMAASMLYAGWMADRLGWEPFSEDRAPLVRFFRGTGDPGQYALAQLFPSSDVTLARGTILSIVLEAQRPSAAPAKFQILRNPSGTSTQTFCKLPNGRESVRTAPLPMHDVSSLLADALDLIAPHRVYRYALSKAVKLVGG
jgi:glucose-6-phosphate dehydrogenase assembly protein OpcA